LASGSGEPSRSGDLIVWNPEDGSVSDALPELHTDSINDIAFSRDGDFIATASADRFGKVVSTADWQVLQSLEGHTAHVNAVAWSANGAQIATGSLDLTVKLWDPLTGTALKTNPGYGKEVTAVAYGGDGLQLISASADKSLRVGNNERFPEVKALLHCATVSFDGEIVVAGDENGGLTGWRVKDRKKLFGF